MAFSTIFKVYNSMKEHVASCRYAEDAAALASLHGDDSTVRYSHMWIVWTEGAEFIRGGESYDDAGSLIRARVEAGRRASGEASRRGCCAKECRRLVRKAIADVPARATAE